MANGNDLCYVALGSNVGDRLRHLSRSIKALVQLEGVELVKTSSLYSTTAQYVSEQPAFLNAVVELRLTPKRLEDVQGLLSDFKRIEDDLGRRPGLRRGPRVIDLDVVAVGQQVLNIKDGQYPLQVPHLLMHERDFVLVPMAEIAPSWCHPSLPGCPNLIDLLKRLRTGAADGPKGASLDAWPVQVLPAAGGLHGRKEGVLWRRGEQTLIMGILNVTPDSFSDGGDHFETPQAVQAAKEMIAAGAHILDIGGESTRPGAVEVSVEEEVKRVVPVIQGIREAGIDATISIDTRKAPVAKAAIEAGADWINDVSGGEFDSGMFAVAVEYMAPIILMHMKGTPETMNSLAKYESVVEEVGDHLLQRRQAAEAAGVPCWNIMLDPGIGFAKDLEHNLSLLRNCSELVSRTQLKTEFFSNFASAESVSREINEHHLEAFPHADWSFTKAFHWDDPGPDFKKRTFGNAAATAIAIAAGADMVRVHEVKEMSQTALVCDRIYKRKESSKL